MDINRGWGIDQPDNYIDIPTLGTPTVGALGAANTAYLSRFRVAKPTPLVSLGAYVGVQNGNIDAGVYVFDGTNWQRLISNGGVAAGAGSSEQVIAMSATVLLAPGVDYWRAFAASDIGTATYLRYNSALGNWMGHGNRHILKAISGPSHILPATISSPSVSGMEIAMMLITA